jgi:hypothetical protein
MRSPVSDKEKATLQDISSVQGFWLNIALGIVGALVGGFLFDLFGAVGVENSVCGRFSKTRAAECLLSGVKRTWIGGATMSAFDPKRTLGRRSRLVPEPHSAYSRCELLPVGSIKLSDQRGERWLCRVVLGPSSSAPFG